MRNTWLLLTVLAIHAVSTILECKIVGLSSICVHDMHEYILPVLGLHDMCHEKIDLFGVKNIVILRTPSPINQCTEIH